MELSERKKRQMKPKFSVVFPKIHDRNISDITIEKMYVSKASRSLRVVFGEGTSQMQINEAEKKLKEYLHSRRSIKTQVSSSGKECYSI